MMKVKNEMKKHLYSEKHGSNRKGLVKYTITYKIQRKEDLRYGS